NEVQDYRISIWTYSDNSQPPYASFLVDGESVDDRLFSTMDELAEKFIEYRFIERSALNE
ncbi:hypothetical protein CEW46_32070, partial [Bacillus cereus]